MPVLNAPRLYRALRVDQFDLRAEQTETQLASAMGSSPPRIHAKIEQGFSAWRLFVNLDSCHKFQEFCGVRNTNKTCRLDCRLAPFGNWANQKRVLPFCALQQRGTRDGARLPRSPWRRGRLQPAARPHYQQTQGAPTYSSHMVTHNTRCDLLQKARRERARIAKATERARVMKPTRTCMYGKKRRERGYVVKAT